MTFREAVDLIWERDFQGRFPTKQAMVTFLREVYEQDPLVHAYHLVSNSTEEYEE